MASFNQVTLLGNTTRDISLKYLPNQTAVAETGLAINRKFRTASGDNREDVCFVDIELYGKQAELANQYVTKGRPILVSGRLKYSSWEDKQGGGKRSKLSIVVENFQFVGGRQEQSDDTDQRPQPARGQTQGQGKQQGSNDPAGDDIPFE